MAGRGKKGVLSKIFVSIVFLLLIFCTVYIVMDIISQTKSTAAIDNVKSVLSKNKSDIGRIDKDIKNMSRQLTKEINSLKQQNRIIANQLRKLSNKTKDSGISWVKNSKNGHKYCLSPVLPWHYAKKWAKEKGGSLVVINNKEENGWLVKTFGGSTEYWIGLTDEADEGKWFWVIGSPAQYFNWLKGEPDNYRKLQHYGIINCKLPGKWNDVAANGSRMAIVEKK